MQSGVFPQPCKFAIVQPLIKKQGLDCNVLNNYKPVSNLPYISKVIEKVALIQINSHLCQNNLFAKCQPACRKSHSTETALVRVQNDVLRSLDTQNDVILVLLDLSAAFDTIDHNTLLHRLRCRFQIIGTVFEWIKSYLHVQGQTQQVRIGSMVSNAVPLNCGVPLEDIILRHGLNYIWCMLTIPNCTWLAHVTMSQLPKLSSVLKKYVSGCMLTLNDSKIEVIRFSSKFGRRSPPRACSVQVGEVSVHSLPEVRDLGVMLDASGTMSAHVTKLCKSASYALWQIGKIRILLDRNSTEKLIYAFVISKLDYCNSLLFGLPEFELRKLQVIQNSAALLVTRIIFFFCILLQCWKVYIGFQ